MPSTRRDVCSTNRVIPVVTDLSTPSTGLAANTRERAIKDAASLARLANWNIYETTIRFLLLRLITVATTIVPIVTDMFLARLPT